MPKIRTNDPMRILIDLLKLIMSPSVNSKKLIDYMEKHKIDPNTYLPSMQTNIQIPLLYYCCSNPNLTDFFLYLIGKKVNLTSQMVSDDPEMASSMIELLYYSQIAYIPTLIEKGATLDPSKIPISCEKLLIKGNITKLITLYKHGAITKDQLLEITKKPALIFRVLDHLYERIYTCCQQATNQSQLTGIINEFMKNYMNVFKLFFKNGVSVDQIENGETFFQRVLNTYFIDLIKLTSDYNPSFDSVEFLHYSNFDLSNRQIMKIYYNDDNFNQINDFLKDKIIPQKINVKKPVIKKKPQQIEKN